MRPISSALVLAGLFSLPLWVQAQTETEPNDNTAQANTITLGTAMNGDIGPAPCSSGNSDD